MISENCMVSVKLIKKKMSISTPAEKITSLTSLSLSLSLPLSFF